VIREFFTVDGFVTNKVSARCVALANIGLGVHERRRVILAKALHEYLEECKVRWAGALPAYGHDDGPVALDPEEAGIGVLIIILEIGPSEPAAQWNVDLIRKRPGLVTAAELEAFLIGHCQYR
jgi:hypothetical protein